MTHDVELQMLKKCIRGDVLHAVLADLLARFCPWMDWISVHKSGLLLVDCRRIVVPQALRQDILKAIHQAHPGLQRSLSLAQCHYVWPGMRSDIAQTVSDCDQCQMVCQAKPVKTPYLNCSASVCWKPSQWTSASQRAITSWWRWTTSPATHGWPRLTSKTTGAVIAIMEKWFCEFGWPQRLGSNGGPQFRQEFEEWCMANNITFELSSARNPASNGLVEAAVK
jgi:hypothetical protein